MPYIKESDREKFTRLVRGGSNGDDLITISRIKEISNNIDNCGDLNYVISIICNEYFKRHGKRYQQINDIVGALEGAKLEFYRRIASPYEDIKIAENGDVFDV